ncbi:hypothetical protein C7212DRAFT_167557 [Tuber magnatum]|uniref:Uncharacterized protein n=1 Tax=Tuber magnatum TaxID=42249 RepID=A0A317SYJ4_9PEZI|nr:hypothetical protein C7212DRAFT_167557 [Tuber magnatum]
MAAYGGSGYPSNYGAYDDRSSRPEMLPFFVSGEGIKRQVIQTDLPRYLGNNAYSRPGQDRQGVDGYWYTAYRPLTDAQIQSLKVDSQKWSSERELMSHRFPGRELPGYERSATFRDSLRTNQDGSNPDNPYTSFPPSNPVPTNFPSYAGPAPGYHHPSAYGAPPAPQGPGVQPAPTGNNNRSRYELIHTADGGRWYDHELKQYVQPSYNPDLPATIPRSAQTDPPAGTTEEPDVPSGVYRRQNDPGAGPDSGSGGYYSQTPYYPRN